MFPTAGRPKLFDGTSKWCLKCGQLKPLDAFYRSKSRASGRQARCRTCQYTPKPKHVEPKKFKQFVCKRCDKAFTKLETHWRGQLKWYPNAGSYCSNSCSRSSQAGKRLKRDPAWTDLQWEWERRLAKEGLSMNRGTLDTAKLYDGFGVRGPAKKTHQTSF